MKCILCGRTFTANPPRRLVCSVCVHDREKRKLELARTAALAKVSAAKKAASAEAKAVARREYKPVPPQRPNLFQLECDRIWRELNVIRFPIERRFKAPTTPPTPFNGDSAA